MSDFEIEFSTYIIFLEFFFVFFFFSHSGGWLSTYTDGVNHIGKGGPVEYPLCIQYTQCIAVHNKEAKKKIEKCCNWLCAGRSDQLTLLLLCTETVAFFFFCFSIGQTMKSKNGIHFDTQYYAFSLQNATHKIPPRYFTLQLLRALANFCLIFLARHLCTAPSSSLSLSYFLFGRCV